MSPEFATLLAELGLPGLIIAGLVWYARSERAERMNAQQNERETLREVLPAVEVLGKALARLESNK